MLCLYYRDVRVANSANLPNYEEPGALSLHLKRQNSPSADRG
jgi:hypothetical protein